MKQISDRLSALVQERGITYRDLAEMTGIPKSALQRYVTGQTPKIPLDRIEALADALGVTAAAILGWENKLPAEAMPYNPVHKIPILGRISAGLPLYAEEHVEGYTYTELNHGGEYFALRVRGDSMTAARIYDNDLLICRKQDIVDNGEIAIVIVGDDEATVKVFRQEGEIVMLEPRSLNPVHQTQIYNLRHTDVRIIGKLIQILINV